MGPQSDFVVVWSSDGSQGSDTSSYSVQGQRYSANGARIGSQFQVNSYSFNGQYSARVSMDALGNFVVVWASYGPDGDGAGIQGQRFDAEGTALGAEFQVNSYTSGNQNLPDVATDPVGNFVVVWQSAGSGGSDTSSTGILGQRFDADGNPLGGEFQVNSFTTDSQRAPAVATDPQGDFVVVWQSLGSYGSDTEFESIQGQRFSANGTVMGGEFQVNSYTTDIQGSPAVATDVDGGFVVTWDSYGSYGSDTEFESIQGQRFDGSGDLIGGQFQINTHTTGWQMYPAVAVGANDGFVVVWTSDEQDGSSTGVFGRAYSADGAPLGPEFPVNSYTANGQYFPGLSIGADGRIVVTWESVGSLGSDSSNTSIQGQRFSTGVLFTDGFESGDLSAWSGSNP